MFEKKFNSDHFDFRRKGSRCRKRSYTRVEKSLKMSKKYKNVKILWASVREPYNYLQAKQLGCDLITIPPTIINKIENFGKSFEKLTKDTVLGFLKDSKKSKFKI